VSLPITKSDDYHGSKTYKSFLLIDSNESLCIENEELFTKKLKCQDTDRLKVVSIFGNTGDGKSHTLNQFFNSQDVFKTSNEQSSCTIGVWSAYHPELKVLFLDTEGLLGLTNNENQRMRLLLKVLAISDIVIYRTRAERLHRDLFSFLGTASMAFCKHFSAALNALGDPQSLGPAVVIFHETHNTKPLRPCECGFSGSLVLHLIRFIWSSRSIQQRRGLPEKGNHGRFIGSESVLFVEVSGFENSLLGRTCNRLAFVGTLASKPPTRPRISNN
jgi:Guanylate-binding protein, N-terminal domain